MKSHRVLILFSLLSIWAATGSARNALTISEVMFDPAGSEYYDEFIEIYNYGENEVALEGWQLSDGTGIDQLVCGQESVLLPGEFAIILDAGYAENSTSYNALIPPNVLRLTISDNAFGSGGLSNSAAETIYLIDAAGDTVSQYTYSLDNTPGHSDEKIDLAGPNYPSNWANSIEVSGTPGFENSRARSHIDLGFGPGAVAFSPLSPVAGDEILISVKLRNEGEKSIARYAVLFYVDTNGDVSPEQDELIGEQAFAEELVAGDSAEVFQLWKAEAAGKHLLLVEARCDEDENPANNFAKAEIIVDYATLDIIITEIMYRPDAGEPEWIEVFNRGETSFDLAGWSFSDSRAYAAVEVASQSTLLDPGTYAIISEDETVTAAFPGIDCSILVPRGGFPALNNDKDAVVIRSATGRTSDSVYYFSAWGGELGISLERKRTEAASLTAENWGSSINPDGGTPGVENSIFPLEIDLAFKSGAVDLDPPLPGAGDNVQLSITVQNKGTRTVQQFHIDLFADSAGQRYEKIDSFDWYGTFPSETAQTARLFWMNVSPGQRSVSFRLSAGGDQDTSNNNLNYEFPVHFDAQSLIINEMMVRPRSGAPEWIELYNPTTRHIDVLNWRFADASLANGTLFAKSTHSIAPGGYAIVASDSSLAETYALANAPVFVPASSFPTLNNDEDAALILDLTGHVIDSVAYSSTWGSVIGVSLERMLPERDSNDSTNWQLSLDEAGATPGRKNSIYPAELDLAILAASLEFCPEQAAYGAADTLWLDVSNPGLTSVPGLKLRLYDNARFDSSAENYTAEFEIKTILPPDSVLSIEAVWFPQHSGIRNILVEVICEGDLQPSNNRIFKTLRVGFPAETLIINEIMYSPLNDFCEWIEVYNKSEQVIDIAEWELSDANTEQAVRLISESRELAPEGYLVIAGDSTLLDLYPVSASDILIPERALPSFNNDIESVVLMDLTGTKIDSIGYSNSMGGASGVSLERMNPDISGLEPSNWGSSVASQGGTPGTVNSIYLPSIPTTSEMSISPNPFSPNHDGIDDVAGIYYQLPVKTARITLKIFDVRGRLIKTLRNNEASSATGSVIWDGRTDDGQFARMGMYVVFMEALDDSSGILKTIRQVVVLAKQL
ncbi:lamin tail domain-containing protein [candidate division KSB1 bacterium]|nr:lamin tail domain-containing protein [candidate division KSB1 bacterium]